MSDRAIAWRTVVRVVMMTMVASVAVLIHAQAQPPAISEAESARVRRPADGLSWR